MVFFAISFKPISVYIYFYFIVYSLCQFTELYAHEAEARVAETYRRCKEYISSSSARVVLNVTLVGIETHSFADYVLTFPNQTDRPRRLNDAAAGTL